jgi:dephospho-CoA kinase
VSASQELERGRLAAEVLENPVYRDALDQIRAEIVTKWQAEKDEKVRDWLWTLMQASKRLDSILTETMNTGLLAQKQLELERSRAERVGRTLQRAFGR